MGGQCNHCGTVLKLGVNWRESFKRYRKYVCVDCNSKKSKEYYYENRESRLKQNKEYYTKNRKKYLEQQKFYNIEKNYGLTKEQYLSIMENATCGICSSKKRLVIDHCHVSGKFRGVLCSTCNSGIGHLKDDVKLVYNAAKYLEEFIENEKD